MEEHALATSIDSPYRPLQSAQGEIRLLQIKPGDYDDVLEVSLKHVRLPQEPAFTALSYVWGQRQSSKPCLVNGVPIPITENLDRALRHFRDPSTVLVLWVDALCINQLDLDERAAQVRLMKELYESAQSIFAWLGQPRDDTKTKSATTLLQTLEQHYAKTMAAEDEATAIELNERMSDFIPVSANSDLSVAWDGIAEMFASEYFTRLWIVQEATAPTDIRFWYGTSSFGRDALRQAVALVDNFASSSDMPSHVVKACNAISSVGQIVESRRERESGRFNTLLRLLQDFRQTKCTDPLDRVYSALGLAKDAPAGQINIDYRADIVDVYSHTARALISDPATSLSVLGACSRPVNGEALLQPQMPSWVPDWRQACMIPGLSAPVNSRDAAEFFYTPYPGPVTVAFDGAKLTVAGIIMHDVQIDTMTKSWDEDFHSWKTALGWYDELIHHREVSPDFEAGLLRTFVGDRWLVGYEEDEALFLWGRGGSMDLEAPKQDAKLLDAESIQRLLIIHHLLATVCFTRKMAILSNKRVAVLPAAAQVGDKVAALRGGHALYIIRASPGQSEYYLVGECYIDGWMDGQVVKDFGEDRLESITLK